MFVFQTQKQIQRLDSDEKFMFFLSVGDDDFDDSICLEYHVNYEFDNLILRTK